MIKVYGGRMGSSLRAHWALAEAGIDYAEMPLNMQNREHKSPDFLKINPNGQVPVLIDGDVILSESMAISSYVIDKYKPELLGSTPEIRGESWKWSIWSYLNIQKHFGLIMFQLNWAPEKDQSAIDKASEEVKPYLVILNEHLAKNKYLTGDEFTVADINAGVAVGYGVFSNYDMKAYSHIVKWFETITARSAYLKATKK